MLHNALSYGGIFALALVAFLATAEFDHEAAAFPRGGIRGGFYNRGYYPHSGYGYVGGYYPHYNHGHAGAYYPYYTYGYAGVYYPYYNSGYTTVYNPYYSYGYTGGYYPNYNFGYTGGYSPYYGTGNAGGFYPYSDPYVSGGYKVDSTPDLPRTSGNTAIVRIRVPLALADVVANGQKMTSTGTDRVFITPELTPGQIYTYTLTATWTESGLPRSETRTVEVQAGKSAVVDFSKK
jgi:uncharacterized protein (TIGR03000 family)